MSDEAVSVQADLKAHPGEVSSQHPVQFGVEYPDRRFAILWVHPRICLNCGHVGCCDSSPGRHARAHARITQHPLIRSLEPGESWSWCFEDEVGMLIPEIHGETIIPPSPLAGSAR